MKINLENFCKSEVVDFACQKYLFVSSRKWVAKNYSEANFDKVITKLTTKVYDAFFHVENLFLEFFIFLHKTWLNFGFHALLKHLVDNITIVRAHTYSYFEILALNLSRTKAIFLFREKNSLAVKKTEILNVLEGRGLSQRGSKFWDIFLDSRLHKREVRIAARKNQLSNFVRI